MIRPANRKRLILLVLSTLGLVGSGLSATDREHQVKTAFIYNFAKFCEWESLGEDSAPFVVGVYQTDAYDDDLSTVLKGKSVGTHPVVVQDIGEEANFPRCRIAVVGGLKGDQIRRLVQVCKNSGTVLVGESPDFAKQGGTIGFVLKDRTIRFEVNLQTAKLDHVKLSSKLLSLATVVYR